MGISAKLETTANVARAVAAFLLSVVLIKVYLLPRPPARAAMGAAPITIGTNMKGRLDGVDWKKNGRTLVLALSTQCHFCT